MASSFKGTTIAPGPQAIPSTQGAEAAQRPEPLAAMPGGSSTAAALEEEGEGRQAGQGEGSAFKRALGTVAEKTKVRRHHRYMRAPVCMHGCLPGTWDFR
jgi:hypothetical protein